MKLTNDGVLIASDAECGEHVIPYLQRRAGRALATVLELELELARARVACDHAVMALKEGRARMVRQGRVKA